MPQLALNTTDPYHLVYRGQKGSVVNMDLTTNNILIGPDEGSLFASNPDTYELGPLNSGYADGTEDLWAIALTGNPVVAFMPGLEGWQPSPAQIQEQLNALGLATEATQQIVKTNTQDTATNVGTVNTTLGVPAQTADIGNLHAPGKTVAAEVAATGAPALRLSTALAHNINQSLVGAGVVTIANNIAITQTSFQFFIQAHLPSGAGTVPFAKVRFIWGDSATTLTTAFDEFFVTLGNGVDILTSIQGPLRGDLLDVDITNLDPAQTMTYGYGLSQTSLPLTTNRILELTATGVSPIVGVITFARPGGSPSAGVIASSNPAIAATASTSRLCPVWAGRAVLNLDNIANANSCTATLTDPASLYSGSVGGSFGSFTAAAGAAINQEIALPNGAVLLNLKNNGATGSISPNVMLTKLEPDA